MWRKFSGWVLNKMLCGIRRRLRWDCYIVKAENGYVVNILQETNDDMVEIIASVYEDTGGATGELEATRAMLYAVAEYFGIYHSEHNKHNLEIRITGKEDENAPRD